MDKVNEVVEACEQETPFHQLSQEEQQRILDANQKKVREAPTLHEWNIRVETPFVWLVISIPVGIMISIGMWLVYRDDDAGWAPIIMGAIVAAFTRYLWLADKNYHYRLTTEGVIVTYQDAIPEAAYTIARSLAWLGVVICVMAVAVLGPLAWLVLAAWRSLRCFSLTLRVKFQSMKPCLEKTGPTRFLFLIGKRH
uniref:hypothetical protein n=1 Tax=Aeromonas hydrophila TaxID=644 RepID=UPI000B29803C|nr:hypothetical protein [Aeromonas hydrophila]